MTSDEMEAFWEEHEDEYIRHENITAERRLHRRPDINAFLLLDKLCPGPNSNGYFMEMVSGAEHDEIFLDVSSEDISHATDEDLLDLIRCGVRYSGEYDSFAMFV
jgi:hypothetical protein